LPFRSRVRGRRNVPAATAFYPLSLHDALPILRDVPSLAISLPVTTGTEVQAVLEGAALGAYRYEHRRRAEGDRVVCEIAVVAGEDRKSTRLNSSHVKISYAVFCLKKKNSKRTVSLLSNYQPQNLKGHLAPPTLRALHVTTASSVEKQNTTP